MDFATWQQLLAVSGDRMPQPFRSGSELMLTITEELGEVAKEVAQLEQVGSKVTWEREPSVERLGEEMTHLLNVIGLLANFYKIDLNTIYTAKTTQNEL
ncbi:MAG: hypothetical protein R3E79_44470 [Caldilineaceae bacterium]